MALSRLLYRQGPVFFNLYGFEAKKIREWKDFLAKSEMLALQSAMNGSSYSPVSGDKLLFHERCLELGIPTPAVHAVVSTRDIGLKTSVPRIGTAAALRDFLCAFPEQRFVLKERKGCYGSDLRSVRLHGDVLYDHRDTPVSLDALWNHCLKAVGGFLIQDHLRVHPELKPLMPGIALGTFRIVTFLKPNDDAEIADALVKIPVIGNVADNFHQGDYGNMLGGLNASTGAIGRVWGMKNGLPIERERHPDTKVLMTNRVIPFWSEITSLARRAAKSFPEMRTAGWDIASTDRGILVMEVNSHYDIDGHQMVIMRGMRPEILAFFNNATNG